MILNQLKTIKCTFFHNFTWMQTIVEYTFKCNFNVHNDYKFVMCKKFQWNIYQGNLHILTMKVNEEDDHMQTFKPLHNLKQFIWTWYSNVDVNLVLKTLMQYCQSTIIIVHWSKFYDNNIIYEINHSLSIRLGCGISNKLFLQCWIYMALCMFWGVYIHFDKMLQI
jgi:hypothetical protein